MKDQDLWSETAISVTVLGHVKAFKAEGLLAMALSQVLKTGCSQATTRWGRDIIRAVLAEISGNLVAEENVHPALLKEAREFIG